MSVADPDQPPRPTAGVDWAQDDHAVAIVAPDGEQTGRFPVHHDAAGLRTLVCKLLTVGVGEVGDVGEEGLAHGDLRRARGGRGGFV